MPDMVEKPEAGIEEAVGATDTSLVVDPDLCAEGAIEGELSNDASVAAEVCELVGRVRAPRAFEGGVGDAGEDESGTSELGSSARELNDITGLLLGVAVEVPVLEATRPGVAAGSPAVATEALGDAPLLATGVTRIVAPEALAVVVLCSRIEGVGDGGESTEAVREDGDGVDVASAEGVGSVAGSRVKPVVAGSRVVGDVEFCSAGTFDAMSCRG